MAEAAPNLDTPEAIAAAIGGVTEILAARETEYKALQGEVKTLHTSINEITAALREKPEATDALDGAEQKKINDDLSALTKKYDDALKRLDTLDNDRQTAAENGVEDEKAAEKILVNEFKSFLATEAVGENLAKNQAYCQLRKKGLINDHTDKAVVEDMVTKAATVGFEPGGGFFVPPTVEATMEKKITEFSDVRPYARVISITTDRFKKPYNLGGGNARWDSEKEAPENTGTPVVEEVEIPVNGLHTYPKATRELLEDSQIDIEAWFAEETALAFAETENSAFINGDGFKKPLGLLRQPKAEWGAAGNFTRQFAFTEASGGVVGTGGSTGTHLDALIDLTTRVPTIVKGGARWFFNKDTEARLRKLKDGDGHYVWAPGYIAGQPSTLLAYPTAEVTQLPNVEVDAFPIIFGQMDRSLYIIDRLGAEVIRDGLTEKPYVKFWTRRRLGAGIYNFEYLHFLKIVA